MGRSTDVGTPVAHFLPTQLHRVRASYRAPMAPDLMITEEHLDRGAISGAGIYWGTVTGLSQEPSPSTHHRAWAARGRKPLTVLDLDYRPMFWPSAQAATGAVEEALGHVTVAVGNLDECEIVVGERTRSGRLTRCLIAGSNS